MLIIKCFDCCEYGHYACDCLKPCNNANIAQESEKNKKVENMLDLDNSSVSKKCAMMCMRLQYEDGDKDLIVYREEGVSTEEHDKAMEGELMKTQGEEEVKYNVALCANNSMSLEKKIS